MIGKKKIQTKTNKEIVIAKNKIQVKSAIHNKEIVIKKKTVDKVAEKINSKLDKEKDKFSNELDAFLNKSKGINVASLAKREQAPYFFDTGNYALNWVVSDDFFKGLPGTKAIVVAGESGKGKSLMCDQFLGLAIGKHNGIAYKVEVEDAGGREFTAAIVGSDEIANKIKIVEPTIDEKGKFKPITIEKLTSFLNQLVQYQISKKSKTPVMVVIDSISQLTSDKEFEDVQKEKDTRDMTVQQKMRAFFRVLTQQQRLANLTIIGVAHMTANIGVMFGPKTVINAKGSGFTYASSLNIEVKGNKEIKGKGDTTIGYMMKLKTSKNRLTFKGREVWIKFYSYGGIDRYSGLCQVLSNYGIFKPSAKPDVNGFYKDSVSFVWKENKFKEKDLPNFIKNWKDGEEALLRSWMKELNDSFEAICKRDGVSEEDLLIDDSEDEIDSTIEEQLE